MRNKLVEPEQLDSWLQEVRDEGKTLATLNGSFDLLHAGHLHMFHSAADQADLLLVALNTDSSIQRYKSPSRPIVPLEDRLQMVAALGCVDAVTYFDETDPRALLERIKPDVHVNGAEYGKDCLEAETVKRHGGRIHIVELVPGRSTTDLIAKIRSCD